MILDSPPIAVFTEVPFGSVNVPLAVLPENMASFSTVEVTVRIVIRIGPQDNVQARVEIGRAIGAEYAEVVDGEVQHIPGGVTG